MRCASGGRLLFEAYDRGSRKNAPEAQISPTAAKISELRFGETERQARRRQGIADDAALAVASEVGGKELALRRTPRRGVPAYAGDWGLITKWL